MKSISSGLRRAEFVERIKRLIHQLVEIRRSWGSLWRAQSNIDLYKKADYQNEFLHGHPNSPTCWTDSPHFRHSKIKRLNHSGPNPHRQQFKRSKTNQIHHRRSHGSIPVFQFRLHIGQLLISLYTSNAFVHPQSLIFYSDVVTRNTNVQTKIQLSRSFLRRNFTFHLAHSAVKHLGIKFETNGLNVSALLSTKQIASATQLQIQCGNFE